MTITQWGTIQSKQLEAFEEQTKDEPYLVLEKIAEDGQTLYWQASFLKEDRHRQEDLLRKRASNPCRYRRRHARRTGFACWRRNTQLETTGRSAQPDQIQTERTARTARALKRCKTATASGTQGQIRTDRYTTSRSSYVPTVEIDRFKKRWKTCRARPMWHFTDAERDNAEVPIRLEQLTGIPFESLTEMYAMPHYNEIDPTPLFAPFYWLFSA